MATVVSIHEARTHLTRLPEQVAAGGRVVICEDGTPVADLVPHQPARVTFGGLEGKVACTDDAFDVDPAMQQLFYGDAATPAPERGHGEP